MASRRLGMFVVASEASPVGFLSSALKADLALCRLVSRGCSWIYFSSCSQMEVIVTLRHRGRCSIVVGRGAGACDALDKSFKVSALGKSHDLFSKNHVISKGAEVTITWCFDPAQSGYGRVTSVSPSPLRPDQAADVDLVIRPTALSNQMWQCATGRMWSEMPKDYLIIRLGHGRLALLIVRLS